jgi:hypothetical protein
MADDREINLNEPHSDNSMALAIIPLKEITVIV